MDELKCQARGLWLQRLDYSELLDLVIALEEPCVLAIAVELREALLVEMRRRDAIGAAARRLGVQAELAAVGA